VASASTTSRTAQRSRNRSRTQVRHLPLLLRRAGAGARVATSAISHGVDVDRFNSMFFAGLPSDIAEYIQASSRVGRTHVGFVMLLPTPQSRRDRYVVETHDIFHRFLERMIAPPAVERWAENAICRVFASYIQVWAITKEGVEFIRTADASKERAPQFDYVGRLTIGSSPRTSGANRSPSGSRTRPGTSNPWTV
jgi:superfamily II DNA/RNA helicase